MTKRFETQQGVVQGTDLIVRWYLGRQAARVVGPDGRAYSVIPVSGGLTWEPDRWNRLSAPIGHLAQVGTHDLRRTDEQEEMRRKHVWMFVPDLVVAVAAFDASGDVGLSQLALEIAFADSNVTVSAAAILRVLDSLLGSIP